MKYMFLDSLKKRARRLKDEIRVLVVAYSDKRVTMLPKIIIGITVAYMLSPIDLIPDFIPIIGLLDDLIIVPALISLSIKLLPPEVLLDARAQIQSGKPQRGPVSWIIAGLIFAGWALSLYFVLRYLVGRIW